MDHLHEAKSSSLWNPHSPPFAIPASTERLLGSEALQILDKVAFKPSKLSPERQGELRQLFVRVKEKIPEGKSWRLEFRSGEALGANAFALPSGIVIVTDRMVAIAKSDDEIASVMAHEIGI